MKKQEKTIFCDLPIKGAYIYYIVKILGICIENYVCIEINNSMCIIIIIDFVNVLC